VEGKTKLLEVVQAGTAAGSFTSRLNGRQKQTNQDANDGDDDEQLDERKCTTMLRTERLKHGNLSV
jgi:hypothetical protein